MYDMIGATAARPVTPRDVWMKTHIYQRGPKLHAITYLAAAGQPEVFRSSVDLRPIARAVRLYHRELHRQAKIQGCVGCEAQISGFFSSIGKVIKKVGRSKLLKKVSRAAKSVVKSKITGAIVAAAAVVYPPVGAPALAAYTAANAALAMAEKGKKVAKTVVKVAKTVVKAATVKKKVKKVYAKKRAVTTRKLIAVAKRKKLTRKHSPKKVARAIRKASRTIALRSTRKALRRHPTAARTVALTARRAKTAKKKLAVARKHKPAIRKVVKEGNKARMYIKKMVATARYSPTANTRREAQKAVRVFNIVASHRAAMKHIAKPPPSPTTGLVIDNRGRILKGRFVQTVATPGAPLQVMLAAQGKVQPGYFRKISGCIGCGG